jgi:hypothetical protein
MAKRGASRNPRRRVKPLPKLKGGELFEITVRSPKNKQTKEKKLPIPKNELEVDEPYE